MPELPEVETTKRGIEPHIHQQTITGIIVRNPNLRWPIPKSLNQSINCTILSVQRRSKYLLLETKNGSIMIHLGMSGRLCLLSAAQARQINKHDHADIIVNNTLTLRYTDPQALWQHPLEY